MKILAAMSGGVDSAVAAARAVEAGHEVVGVHLPYPACLAPCAPAPAAAAPEDSMDARRVCLPAGHPLLRLGLLRTLQGRRRRRLHLRNTNGAGRTPNPACAATKRSVRGAPRTRPSTRFRRRGDRPLRPRHHHRRRATANCTAPPTGPRTVLRARSAHHEQLAKHAWFPGGHLRRRRYVREAAERGFSVAKKPDSYDICFIPEGDTRARLGDHTGPRPHQRHPRRGARRVPRRRHTP